MSSSPSDDWSIRKSLAFLAATFAIVFGSLLPAAVAASPAGGVPVMLCSGAQTVVVYDADGRPQPVEHDEFASLTCAGALLSGLAAVSPPPLPAATPALPRARIGETPDLEAYDAETLQHPAPRPPSTAPPRF